MSAEIGVAFIGGAVVGSVLAWAYVSESDEQARLREERWRRQEEDALKREHEQYIRGNPYAAHQEELIIMKREEAPAVGTLRYECAEYPQDLPKEPLNRILKFSNEHAIAFDGFTTSLDITGDAEAFFNRINECKSEYESRQCMFRFKTELEFKIKNSDIPDEYKEKFHVALNPLNDKNILSALVAVTGLCIGAFYAPYGLLLPPVLYVMMQQFCPEMRYFPLNSGAAADSDAFRILIAELNNLVTKTENAMRPSLRV